MKWQDYEFLNIIASFLLLLISLVLTVKRKTNSTAGRLLSLYFWAFFLAVVISYTVHFNYVLKIPHLFRTGHIFTLLIMPFSYLYVLQNLYPRKFRYADLLHLLPLLIYLMDYFPFFILSGQEKIQLFQQLDDNQKRIGHNEGWFMPMFGHVIIRYFMAFIYCIAQYVLVRRAERNPEHPVMFENPDILHWMKILTASESIFFLMPLAASLFLSAGELGVVATIAALLVSLIQGYYLFFSPTVLYGIHEFNHKPLPNDLVSPSELSLDEKDVYYSDEMLDQVGRMLESYMETAKPYLKSGLKVSDLAEETGISVHRISAYCNRKKKLNFFGFINQYRIHYCLEKFALGEHERKTLEALAEECGFNSRGTFIRVFKSITGQTPTEYLSMLQKSVPL